MKKVIPTQLTWKRVESENPTASINSLAAYENFLMNNHGFVIKVFSGMIGQGSKVHKLICLVKEHEDYYEIANCFSYCGSSKWGSRLVLLEKDTEITCKRC
jgi:hypothetical protein